MPQSNGYSNDVSTTGDNQNKPNGTDTYVENPKSLDRLISWLTREGAVINKVVERNVPGTAP